MSSQEIPDITRILAAAAEIGALGAGKATLPVVLCALCDPQTTAVEVARVIAQEPGLAARVLRVANSAYYGLSGKVATLERAFVLLGVDAVSGIAAAACLDRAAARALDNSPIDLQQMLRHSVATAAAADALARASAHRRSASEAFIAGLLHDFGVTVQLRVDRAAFEQLIAIIDAGPPEPVRTSESRVHSIGHEWCAAVVFETWKLPPSLVAAVRNHHDPLAAPESARVVCTLVHVANHLAVQLGFGYALEPIAGSEPTAALQFLGLSAEAVNIATQDLPQRVAELQRVMADPG